MRISPVSGGSSRSADIAQLFALHTAMLDGAATPLPAAAPGTFPAANGALPSAALVRPTYRPAYLGRTMPRRGGQPDAKRAGRHRPHGEVAAPEPPGWDRMAPGSLGRERIPDGDRFGEPIRAESVRGRRVGAQPGQVPDQSGQSQLSASWIVTAGADHVRQAILGRQRCLAWMAPVASATPLPAAVF